MKSFCLLLILSSYFTIAMNCSWYEKAFVARLVGNICMPGQTQLPSPLFFKMAKDEQRVINLGNNRFRIDLEEEKRGFIVDKKTLHVSEYRLKTEEISPK